MKWDISDAASGLTDFFQRCPNVCIEGGNISGMRHKRCYLGFLWDIDCEHETESRLVDITAISLRIGMGCKVAGGTSNTD
ncbi:hypothetical protein EON83_27980 [bacterium]|nr:MAG: hypothetical protein EON83_27980 [bacterium]